MAFRLIATAALAVSVALTAGAARADCLWDVGMAERDLFAVERAAPLAADRDLQLGPGTSVWRSGAKDDFAERSLRAFGEVTVRDEPAPEDGASRLEERIAQAREGLIAAQHYASRSDMEACAAALDQARQAIAGARAAFR